MRAGFLEEEKVEDRETERKRENQGKSRKRMGKEKTLEDFENYQNEVE
jgi:hypothetical protein